MKLHLVSFPICPFVQRVALALEEKGVAYEVTYIDLNEKPAWFLAKAPRGKVPALIVTEDGGRESVLVESQAIVEFVDEAFPGPPLLPADPLLRARDRAWFAFAADDLVLPSHRLLMIAERPAYDAAIEKMDGALRRLEAELDGRDWLSGDGARFGLADVAVGPVFTRLDVLERLGGWRLPRDLPNVAAWRARLTARPSMKAAVAPQFEEVMLAKMRAKDALALRVGAAVG